MTDRTEPAATNQIRREIASTLRLDEFDAEAYQGRSYLRAALEAGFDVADLARAHDVSKKTIYRAIDQYDLTQEQPPRNGTARWLWNAPPDAVPGDD
ncbi:transposase [Haloarcula sediminis]|uniref:transposase n=1 Tax=Haloarcula sediminis TaxID=3111777 RepID=UPI002D78D6EA|nr:transposase [Haloarcula sp. CK38]